MDWIGYDPATGGAYDDNGYYGAIRHDMLELLPSRLGTVLDVGCGTGNTGARLLDTGAADSVDGLELDRAAAGIAARRYRSVWQLDLDTPDLGDSLGTRLDTQYDTIMCNDVLEHLRHPWSALGALVDHLQPSGLVAVSLPNVQSVEVLAPLVAGRFDYRDSGVLDRTHLRFFTRSSARRMLTGAGLEVVDERRTRIGGSRSRTVRAMTRLAGPFGVRQLLFLARRS